MSQRLHSPASGRFASLRARLAGILRLLREPRARSELATRFAAGKRLHQDNSLTWPDRYPLLFAEAQALLAGRPALRILSFGCSSGEEVLTLRKYFPEAVIVGAELNRRLLRACRRLPVDDGVRFIASAPEALAAHGPFDAIFCMAVLARRPHEVAQRGMRSIADFYPYRRFAAQVEQLCGLLADGGLLIAEHALYRVEEAIEGLPVEAVTTHGYRRAKGPRFDRAGALIAPQPMIARIFRREAA